MPNPLKGASNISRRQGKSGTQEKERKAGEANII
jgi:hypothetical protein